MAACFVVAAGPALGEGLLKNFNGAQPQGSTLTIELGAIFLHPPTLCGGLAVQELPKHQLKPTDVTYVSLLKAMNSANELHRSLKMLKDKLLSNEGRCLVGPQAILAASH